MEQPNFLPGHAFSWIIHFYSPYFFLLLPMLLVFYFFHLWLIFAIFECFFSVSSIFSHLWQMVTYEPVQE